MKQFDRIFIIVITVIVIFFAGLNIILVNNNKDLYNGRPVSYTHLTLPTILRV